jgi:hypothetical protein
MRGDFPDADSDKVRGLGKEETGVKWCQTPPAFLPPMFEADIINQSSFVITTLLNKSIQELL